MYIITYLALKVLLFLCLHVNGEHITSRVHKQHKAPLMPDGVRGVYTQRRHF